MVGRYKQTGFPWRKIISLCKLVSDLRPINYFKGEITIEVTGVVRVSPALWYFRYIASIFLTLHKRLWFDRQCQFTFVLYFHSLAIYSWTIEQISRHHSSAEDYTNNEIWVITICVTLADSTVIFQKERKRVEGYMQKEITGMQDSNSQGGQK